jgi:hypothetical protein
VRFLHLAQHKDLRESDNASKCVLWVEAKLEPEQADLVAAQARLIYKKNSLGGIPYGFSPYDGYFGAKGEIRWSTPGRGLTCSTFVLSAFDRAGVRLVKGETWPENRKEDIEFQTKMIENLRSKGKATASHLKGLEQDVGQVRYRPIEVAGALAASTYPCDFDTAELIGAKLIVKMNPPAPVE